MIDRRRDTIFQTLLRVVVSLVASILGLFVLYQGAVSYGETSSAIHRHRAPATLPRVFVQGTIRSNGAYLPPLCTVDHEHYGSCGKTSCWRSVEAFRASHAKIDVEWSSSELPKQMDLGASFQFEPWRPDSTLVGTNRSQAWQTYAKEHSLGFASSFSSSNERIVDGCLEEGTKVYLQACVSPTQRDLLEACPGEARYGVTSDGDRQAVIDDAADRLARYVTAAAFAFLVAALAWFKKRLPLATGLEDRAAVPHRRTLGGGWALLAVPPVAGFAVILMHGLRPPSTWSTGRGGFAFAITALVVWLIFSLNRLIERRRTQFALAPVLATSRSLLAQASGTAELAVRARKRGEGIRAFIGDDVVAFSHLRISEVYKSGKSTSTEERLRMNVSDELEVVDESGDGVLHMGSSILDVELRRITMVELSPRYAERGVRVDRSGNHVHYLIEEHVIKDGQQLYVLGDVSKLEMKADGAGYRAVRGTPTLGAAGAAPILVHAGDERGLIDVLTRDARAANSYAVIAALMCAGIGAALVALAML